MLIRQLTIRHLVCLLIFLAFTLALTVSAEAQDLIWAARAGGSGDDFGQCIAVLADGSALENMIEAAGDLIEDGLYDEACDQLAAAANKCDGQPNPPDFVTGEAAPATCFLIELLRETLGCEGP